MMQGMTAPVQTPLLVAVSGGIDSVVMLDVLAQKNTPLIVAHVDHGIRVDSHEDEALVRSLAERYGFPFLSIKLKLGPAVSEDAARQARYAWLEQMRQQYQALAIATAHHQDDVLETIIINLTRGTGWRGLCSLRETPLRHRPLLAWSKAAIIDYALSHGLEWREDSTNESFRYLRNRIRNLVTPRLAPAQRQQLLALQSAQLKLREDIDTELSRLAELYHVDGALECYPLIMCPDSVACELLRSWLGEPLEQQRMRDLLLFSKTAREGAKWSLDGKRFVVMKKHRLIVQSPRD
jgi:tRNA(Ile)-lysidine synthetase-like protein